MTYLDELRPPPPPTAVRDSMGYAFGGGCVVLAALAGGAAAAGWYGWTVFLGILALVSGVGFVVVDVVFALGGIETLLRTANGTRR